MKFRLTRKRARARWFYALLPVIKSVIWKLVRNSSHVAVTFANRRASMRSSLRSGAGSVAPTVSPIISHYSL